MKKFIKIVLKVLGVMVALGVMSIYMTHSRLAQHIPDCPRGNVYKIDHCDKAGSAMTYEGLGTSYFFSKGPVDQRFCRAFHPGDKWLEKSQFEFVEFSATSSEKAPIKRKFEKRDCADFLSTEESKTNVCYYSEYYSQEFNSRYRRIMISDENCKAGRYFYGDGYLLKDSKPVYVGLEIK